MRDGVGHSDVLGIRAHVRPALVGAAPEQVRGCLRQLFLQQRQLQSQRALDNWELLGAAAKSHAQTAWLARVSAENSAEERALALLLSSSSSAASPSASSSASNTNKPTKADEERWRALARRAHQLKPLLARLAQRRAWLTEVHGLRAAVVAAVQRRLLTHTLQGLARLTDAANRAPHRRPATPRTKPSDALAAAIFAGPPVLPFVSLLHGDEATATGGVDDGGIGPGTAGGGRDNGDDPSAVWGEVAASELWTLPARRHGLSEQQLQRIMVVQGYWPADFGRMGARLQRQVLADAVRYCLEHDAAAEGHMAHMAHAHGHSQGHAHGLAHGHGRHVAAAAARTMPMPNEPTLLFGDDGPPQPPREPPMGTVAPAAPAAGAALKRRPQAPLVPQRRVPSPAVGARVYASPRAQSPRNGGGGAGPQQMMVRPGTAPQPQYCL